MSAQVYNYCIDFFHDNVGDSVADPLYVGLMQPEHLVLGLLAVLPLMGGMPLGAYILRQTTPNLFDKVILFILVGVAMRLLWAL